MGARALNDCCHRFTMTHNRARKSIANKLQVRAKGLGKCVNAQIKTDKTCYVQRKTTKVLVISYCTPSQWYIINILDVFTCILYLPTTYRPSLPNPTLYVQYLCMYVCMYVCTYVCMYVWLYVCMYVCMSVCMYVCLYVWLYGCMYVCMVVCTMYVCMYVCMYLLYLSLYLSTVPIYLDIRTYCWLYVIRSTHTYCIVLVLIRRNIFFGR